MSTVNNPIQHTAGDRHAAGTFVQYKNGAIAQVQNNGQFKIVSMPMEAREKAKANLARARSKGRYSKKISKMAAARAFNKYYKGKAYKTEKARKAAMTRDMCHNKSHQTRDTTAYRANPGRFDYKGVDDGSRCPKGRKVRQHVTRDMSAVRNARRSQTAGAKCSAMKTRWCANPNNNDDACAANEAACRSKAKPKAKPKAKAKKCNRLSPNKKKWCANPNNKDASCDNACQD